MKATELMIGDWVLFYDELQHALKLCGIDKTIEL